MESRQNPISRFSRIKVGITIGDPSGIGPTITSKVIHKLKGLADFVVIGDEMVFNKASKPQPTSVKNYKFVDLNNVDHKNFSFGRIRAEYGRASMEYLDKALELIDAGKIDCLVTCPISKEAINLAGFHYQGHTEYLAKRSKASFVVMMLLNKYLRFSLVTQHLPLKKVPLALNQADLCKNIILTNESLKKLFSIARPRIVVCGLNPHASDNGVIGKEENAIIKPAIRRLKKKAIDVSGPISSDVAIAGAYRKEYDCIIAMYHDQALIPLKLCDRGTGVNMTLGLSFVRTSPLHGTAFDIAGNHQLADETSLFEAIKLAVKCTLNLKRN